MPHPCADLKRCAACFCKRPGARSSCAERPKMPAALAFAANRRPAALTLRDLPCAVIIDFICLSFRAFSAAWRQVRSSSMPSAKSGSARSKGITTSPPVCCWRKRTQPSRSMLPCPSRTASEIRAPVQRITSNARRSGVSTGQKAPYASTSFLDRGAWPSDCATGAFLALAAGLNHPGFYRRVLCSRLGRLFQGRPLRRMSIIRAYLGQ